MNDSGFILLKLGGSLITDKSQAQTPRLGVLRRLADEIAFARQENPAMKLVLGHGSGSFGHIPAKHYGTRHGVSSPEEWHGFIEVWRAARTLHQIVLGSFEAVGLPAISFSPSACVQASSGKVVHWDLSPLDAALHAGLLPVIHGDVAFDTIYGGTILSTEDLFFYLAQNLSVKRILLAGIEPGVWLDYPACTQLVPEINPEKFPNLMATIHGSEAIDVTGGMESKVQQSLELAQLVSGLEVFIFSGAISGELVKALQGQPVGTRIYSA